MKSRDEQFRASPTNPDIWDTITTRKAFAITLLVTGLLLCQISSVNNVWLRYDSGFNDPVGVLQGRGNLQHIRCPAERMFLFEVEEFKTEAAGSYIDPQTAELVKNFE